MTRSIEDFEAEIDAMFAKAAADFDAQVKPIFEILDRIEQRMGITAKDAPNPATEQM